MGCCQLHEKTDAHDLTSVTVMPITKLIQLNPCLGDKIEINTVTHVSFSESNSSLAILPDYSNDISIASWKFTSSPDRYKNSLIKPSR